MTIETRRRKPASAPRIVKHEKPFRCSNPGKFGRVQGPLNPFPEHMPEPIRFARPVKKEDSMTKIAAFK